MHVLLQPTAAPIPPTTHHSHPLAQPPHDVPAGIIIAQGASSSPDSTAPNRLEKPPEEHKPSVTVNVIRPIARQSPIHHRPAG